MVRTGHFGNPRAPRLVRLILWPFVVGSAIGIPIGTRLLGLLDPNRFKLVLGSLLVICCSMMLATAKLPRIHHGGKFADAFVGLLGGVMAPLSGFSGLAPALWCTLRGYNKDEHRAVIQNFNLIVLSATLATNILPAASAPIIGRRWPSLPDRWCSPRFGAPRSTSA